MAVEWWAAIPFGLLLVAIAVLPLIPATGEPRVAGVPEGLLVAVSLGAVLGGAITYIGNGPNFLTKAVAESAGVAMPSFGGYLRWSAVHLLPVLAVMALLFLVDGPLWTGLGVLGGLALLVRALVAARAPRELRLGKR
ncbi:MAG: sodium:proton antiporter [Propionibacteriaceae bacterium]|nr:sodium:proton antiporter [Propionibacteriaceae bacterium]